MKKLYIAKGQTVQLDSVYQDEIIVKGSLVVTGDIKARMIKGHGSVQARNIYAKRVSADSITVDESLVAEKVVCDRICGEYGDIKGTVKARLCLMISHLKAGRAATVLLGAQEADCAECIVLPKKNYSRFLFHLAVFWRALLDGPSYTDEPKIQASSGNPQMRHNAVDKPVKSAEPAKEPEWATQMIQTLKSLEQHMETFETSVLNALKDTNNALADLYVLEASPFDDTAVDEPLPDNHSEEAVTISEAA